MVENIQSVGDLAAFKSGCGQEMGGPRAKKRLTEPNRAGSTSNCHNVQRPTPSGSGMQVKVGHLSLSPPQSQPQYQPRPQQPRASIGSDQHHRNQASSSGSRHSGQLGETLKTPHEEVRYLNSIDFTSPSGITRKYNVITRDENGCVTRRSALQYSDI
jgi:hypothetical protein